MCVCMCQWHQAGELPMYCWFSHKPITIGCYIYTNIRTNKRQPLDRVPVCIVYKCCCRTCRNAISVLFSGCKLNICFNARINVCCWCFNSCCWYNSDRLPLFFHGVAFAQTFRTGFIHLYMCVAIVTISFDPLQAIRTQFIYRIEMDELKIVYQRGSLCNVSPSDFRKFALCRYDKFDNNFNSLGPERPI